MDASLRPDAAIDSVSYTADVRMADEAPIASAAASARDPLPIVLKAALTHAEKADKADKSAQDHRISAGLRFKELKERVSSGEAGKRVSWASYCAKHVPTLTQRTVDRYIAIADGKAPNASDDSSTPKDWSRPGEEEAMRRADFLRAMEAAMEDGDPETAFGLWCIGQPDSPYARAAWNAMCDDFNKGRGKVWDGVKDAPYHWWRNARGFPDDAKSRAMWGRGDTDGSRDDVDDSAKSSTAANPSAPKGEDPEKRKARQKAYAARARAKSSSIREANGGKASKPRQDRETAEQYGKLAAIAKVLDAGQLQIINEMIEERWPGTWAKADAAKAARDAAA